MVRAFVGDSTTMSLRFGNFVHLCGCFRAHLYYSMRYGKRIEIRSQEGRATGATHAAYPSKTYTLHQAPALCHAEVPLACARSQA